MRAVSPVFICPPPKLSDLKAVRQSFGASKQKSLLELPSKGDTTLVETDRALIGLRDRLGCEPSVEERERKSRFSEKKPMVSWRLR